MKLTLSIPRSRAAHLAGLPAPEGCDAPLLQLKGKGDPLIAERDPVSPVYHVNLPALDAGKEVSFEGTGVGQCRCGIGISHRNADGKLDVSLAGSRFMTFHHATDYPSR